nr:PREDICTED: sterile alpha and TIR motif-containing protein 1 isoform X3 [Bemisia tabaci]
MHAMSPPPNRINRQFKRSITAPADPFGTRFSMSDFSDEENKMAAVMENFQKKNSVGSIGSRPHINAQQMMNTTKSRVAKTSHSSTQRIHHMSSEMKSLKASELAALSSEMFPKRRTQHHGDVSLSSSDDEYHEGPVVTYPESPPPVTMSASGTLIPATGGAANGALATATSTSSSSSSSETVKFEKKRMTSSSESKVVTDAYSSEKSTANSAEMRSLQAGELSYQENSAAAKMRARLEMDGVSAEKAMDMLQEQRCLKSNEMSHEESQNMSSASVKLQTESYSAEKKAMASQQQRQSVTSTGIFNKEKHIAQSAQSNITITSKGVCTKSLMTSASSQLSQLMNGTNKTLSLKLGNTEEEVLNSNFEDLERLCAPGATQQDVEKAILKYSLCLDSFMKGLSSGKYSEAEAPRTLNCINEMMQKAWAVPTHGHELGYSLCNTLRNCGGLDLLMTNCSSTNDDLRFSTAKLLEQCLTTENRAHVVANGLEKVVKAACSCTKNTHSAQHSRVGTGILEHLFKHSEGACSDLIDLGGLDTVLFECRKSDIETLRHCAGALANLSLYGGADNQEAMIQRKAPMWLFPLAFNNDDHIKYYACLAITILVANKEIEAAVLQSGTLDLVEPFVTSHSPSEFAKSNEAHAHGQSKNWLQKLVPVLNSKREEARNLAAFHFCMEAGIKKQQGKSDLFREIGAIEPLKKVASCPNAIASKFAAQALRLMGEEVPHKLSQQVPLWSIEDVREWVKQIGFPEFAANFVESRVDGDLLLQLTEENLKYDIGIKNGLRLKGFMREMNNLKTMADYSSRDPTRLNDLLQNIGPLYGSMSIYAYSMLTAGVDKDSLRNLTEEQLQQECGIENSIHRGRIMEAISGMIKDTLVCSSESVVDKPLDVFISYRRSNGSQLASLLKVHLQVRNFTAFIDVEKLEAGKFDNNLLNSIRQARHFLLILTPNALHRCIGDTECKDWVHKEIVAALNSQCNIIPITDTNFVWPQPEELPEDMRAICHFNGVRWIHDYQDACVDKLVRFMQGEISTRGNSVSSFKGDPSTPGTPHGMMRSPPSYRRMQSSDSGKSSDKDSGGKD